MQALTDFGDSAVLVPVALVVFGFLLASGARQTAWLWAMTIVSTGVLLLVLKLLLLDCGMNSGQMRLSSPSGHAGMSMAFFIAFAVLIANQFSPPWRYAVIGFGMAFGVAIAMSRIAPDIHSTAEVLLGSAIGLGAAAFFAYTSAALPAVRLRRAPLWILVCAGTLFLLHGERLNAEITIQNISARLLPDGGVCADTQAD